MLALVEKGLSRSKDQHNCTPEIVADWIEASVAFGSACVSKADVVEALIEGGFYDTQSFAAEFVEDLWGLIRKRQRLVASRGIVTIAQGVVQRSVMWSDRPEYAFCLLLSLQTYYSKWREQFGTDYSQQGGLFEELTLATLKSLGWRATRTGWGPNQKAKIAAVVRVVSDHIGEPAREAEVPKWMGKANEAGLDIVCTRPFPDKRGGRPLVFLQCASGANWDDKLHTPNIDIWRQVMQFTTPPQRGMAMPFALSDSEFVRASAKVAGTMMDRYRLLSPLYYQGKWIDNGLAARLVKWMRPRVKVLPVDGS